MKTEDTTTVCIVHLYDPAGYDFGKCVPTLFYRNLLLPFSPSLSLFTSCLNLCSTSASTFFVGGSSESLYYSTKMHDVMLRE